MLGWPNGEELEARLTHDSVPCLPYGLLEARGRPIWANAGDDEIRWRPRRSRCRPPFLWSWSVISPAVPFSGPAAGEGVAGIAGVAGVAGAGGAVSLGRTTGESGAAMTAARCGSDTVD